MAKTYPPIFFVSYARADAEYPEFRESMRKFVDDLSAKVAVGLPTPRDGVSFMDGNIQAGELWSDTLGDALMQCRVGLALYSPSYFASRWCGKEFQVFLNRSQPNLSGTGVVPVRWMKRFPDPPESVARIQYQSGEFPPEYASMGMQQLVTLRSAFPVQYELSLDVLANRVIAEAAAGHLGPSPALNFDEIQSAWEDSVTRHPESHTKGNISKTCFVFISRKGWDWVPYQGTTTQIGALAQKITGDLGLRYEEIPYDAALPQKLKEANDSDVPTVLFGDPASLNSDVFASPMHQYDRLYLLNCAALIPWEPGTKELIETDPRWIYFKTKVCKQKVDDPPPYHEWRSIFSQDELDQKTRTLIEQIRSRLMKQLVSDPTKTTAPRVAEDAAMSKSAAALGIVTSSLSHLGN